MNRTIDAPKIGRRLGIDPRIAWVMAYHDVSWYVLGLLVESGLVRPLSASPATSTAHGYATLIRADSAFLAVLTDTL
jgi:hypothetical protein